MALERRPAILLGVLVVVSAASAYLYWPRTSGVSTPTAPARGPVDGRPIENKSGAPDVHLEALDGARPQPGDAERNLFRFEQRVVRGEAPAARPTPPPDLPPPGPPPPPPVPPIPLRFIGLVEGAQKLAILSDGRGAPMYGKEGEIVLGQYKIERIGVESIDLSYLDGRGRQTIRLSGS